MSADDKPVSPASESVERQVAERAALLQLLHDVATAANGAPSLEMAASTVLPAVARYFGWLGGVLLLPATDAPGSLIPAEAAIPDAPPALTEMVAATRAAEWRADDLPARVLTTGQPQWTDDAPARLSDPRATAAQTHNLRFAVAFPIVVGPEIVGVLEFYAFAAAAPDGPTLAALAGIGAQFGRLVARERLHRQRDQVERLASLGTFAAGMAHELNSPLASILLTARFARRPERTRDELDELLGEILADAERCAQIIRNVLRFARQNPGAKTTVQLNDILARVVNAAEPRAQRQAVALETTLAAALPPVRGNAAELEQAFADIVANALEASPTQSVVTVRTSHAADRVQVEVTDVGRGMTPQDAERALEPFFTTRAGEGRAGLGLSLAHGIITEHTGRLHIDTRPGRGTTLCAQFPPLAGD
jgi:signal transduction histidine kinase